MAIIYKITNKTNGKVYIGFTTKTLEQRWKKHLEHAKKGDTYFYNAIRKYGKDAWTLETIIHSDDIDFIKEMEKFCIAEYGTLDSAKGYNMTQGGDGGVPNEATRVKMSNAHRGENNGMFGKKHSPETLQKLSGKNHHMFGKKHSPETLQKMRDTLARRKAAKNA